jgi:hypothetical protein
MTPSLVTVGCALVAVVLFLAAWRLNRKPLLEPRFEGTWQSDAEATIAYMRKVRPIDEDQERTLRRIFGKMRITFIDQTVTTDGSGTPETATYQVLKRDGNVVVVRARTTDSGKDWVFTIRFADENTYWVYLEPTTTWECFRRVK